MSEVHRKKICFRCLVEKPLSEFYHHSRMADGHLNKCKDCTRVDSANRHKKLLSDPVLAIAEAKRHRLKSEAYRKTGRAKPLTKEYRREVARRHRAKYPLKEKARSAMQAALKSGAITSKPCEVCGSEDSEGHHEDYSKPLDVIWLCPKHHAERHVELRDKTRAKTF